MRLLAECDHCLDQQEVSQWDADSFQIGTCEYCGEGMCRSCHEEGKPCHTNCVEEYEAQEE